MKKTLITLLALVPLVAPANEVVTVSLQPETAKAILVLEERIADLERRLEHKDRLAADNGAYLSRIVRELRATGAIRDESWEAISGYPDIPKRAD